MALPLYPWLWNPQEKGRKQFLPIRGNPPWLIPSNVAKRRRAMAASWALSNKASTNSSCDRQGAQHGHFGEFDGLWILMVDMT